MIRKSIGKIKRKINGENTTEKARLELLDALSGLKVEIKEEISNNTTPLQEATNALAGQVIKRQDVIMRALAGLRLETMFKRDTSVPAIYILATHDFGNIGDLAIGCAQSTFVKGIFPGREVYEISRLDLLSNWSSIQKLVTNKDLIILPGGGNMGDIWGGEESVRRAIVKSFKQPRIISFPQSIKFYSKDELKKSADIYNNHKKLMIAVRDDASYELAIKHFSKVTIVRTSDIVMSYDYPVADREETNAIAFVMRSDKEKNLSNGINKLYEKVENAGYAILNTDTVDVDLFGLDSNNAAFLTYTKIDLIHTARLVITDRLHGAIFGLLAGRPVIVFDNSYGKIKGALQKIKQVYGDRIVFASDDGGNVDIEAVKKMYNLGESSVSLRDTVREDFVHFSEEIKSFVKE